jgi:hypothetical protein
MAFVQQAPRLFTRQNIEAINPSLSGVYGLFKEGAWVYVGKGNIRERLLAHLNGDNSFILKALPTHWVDEVCNDPVMSAREKQLILEFSPLCNQKVG